MDIMHDRAGYYICWGCLVWVPSVYTSPAMALVGTPVHLGTPLALAIFAAGAAAIWINYDSDRQLLRPKLLQTAVPLFNIPMLGRYCYPEPTQSLLFCTQAARRFQSQQRQGVGVGC